MVMQGNTKTQNPSPVELSENTQTQYAFAHGVLGLVIL